MFVQNPVKSDYMGFSVTNDYFPRIAIYRNIPILGCLQNRNKPATQNQFFLLSSILKKEAPFSNTISVSTSIRSY